VVLEEAQVTEIIRAARGRGRPGSFHVTRRGKATCMQLVAGIREKAQQLLARSYSADERRWPHSDRPLSRT
jgi:hypothetical protein